LVARDIEVEFVNFGKSLPQMLDATSTSKSTKAHKMDYVKITPLQSEATAAGTASSRPAGLAECICREVTLRSRRPPTTVRS
jgi:hypothetical protein